MSSRIAVGAPSDQPDDLPIEALDLRVRTYNVLKRSGLHTVGQIMALERTALLGLRHFSRESYEDLRDQLIRRRLIAPDTPRGPFSGDIG